MQDKDNMNEQMSLFDMGGLADDGAMRDPVSGNEVPPGSMASEVRDDVPAMLSEGEYIVPADVVRFFGVRFFEDLRSQAKQGLMDMERNGRIGGEPVDAPMTEGDLTPEEMAMLTEITGMYAGGDVKRSSQERMSLQEVLSSNMSIYDAINSPVRVYTPGGDEATTPEMKRELFQKLGLIQIAEASGMAQGGMVMEDPRMAQYNMASYAASIPNQPMRGFNEGGLQPGVASMTQEDFMNQAQQGGGFQLPRSIFTPPAPTTPTTQEPEFTPVMLYSPTGIAILASSQEQYNDLIAQGYTTSPSPTPVTPDDDSGDGGDGGPPGGAGGGFSLSEENREALASDPLKFGTEALGFEMPFGADTGDVAGLGLIAAGPAGALAGGFVGAAMELDNIAKAKAGLIEARAQGLQDTPEFAALDAAVKAAEKDLSGPARFLSNVLGFGDGKNYAASVTGMTPTPPTRAGVTPPGSGVTPPGGGGGTPRAPTTSPVPTQRPDRDSDGPAAESPADRARRGSEAVISAAEKNLASEEELADMRAEATKAEAQLADIESRASGGRNTTGRVGFEGGGLVAKPTRKKPVAKKK